MNKYVSNETKKWQRREEILEILQPVVNIVSIGITIIILLKLL